MRVFLTGASGNVGGAVLRELIARGHEVVALIRSGLPAVRGYRPVMGSLSRVSEHAAEIGMAQAVVHCASPRALDRATVLAEDIDGTAQLLDAWSNGPFVFASSQTVYGIPRRDLVEDAALDAGNWYDLAKICNEQQIAMQAGRNGRGSGISLRLPLIFGSGARRHDRQFLSALFSALRKGHSFLFGDEKAMETAGSVFMGEDDCGCAMVDALEIAKSGSYNLAGGFCTWRELIETLARHAGLAPRFVVRLGAVPREGEFRLPQSRSFYDCSKFYDACRFRPRCTLDEAIGRFVAAERSGLSS